MMKTNQIAVMAANNNAVRETLIKNHEYSILAAASSVCKRYVTKSDDEWSVALFAFSRAIDCYAEDKGDFIPFALMLIKRAVIDYFRSQKNYSNEILTAPHILEGNGEPEEDNSGVYFSVVKASKEQSDAGLSEEISAANEMLMTYGFRFYDLTECSPKQDKTKEQCAKAIRYILDQYPPALLEELIRCKKLPVTALSHGSGVSKKTIDRYRKYIIMGILILNGDYPHISEYLKFVRKESSK